jgi:hypothetical protein
VDAEYISSLECFQRMLSFTTSSRGKSCVSIHRLKNSRMQRNLQGASSLLFGVRQKQYRPIWNNDWMLDLEFSATKFSNLCVVTILGTCVSRNQKHGLHDFARPTRLWTPLTPVLYSPTENHYLTQHGRWGVGASHKVSFHMHYCTCRSDVTCHIVVLLLHSICMWHHLFMSHCVRSSLLFPRFTCKLTNWSDQDFRVVHTRVGMSSGQGLCRTLSFLVWLQAPLIFLSSTLEHLRPWVSNPGPQTSMDTMEVDPLTSSRDVT